MAEIKLFRLDSTVEELKPSETALERDTCRKGCHQHAQNARIVRRCLQLYRIAR